MEEVVGDAGVLVDPLDVALDRGRDRGGRPPPRRARPARARARAALHLGARGRGRGRRLPAGGRMSEPLVVVDADVLGRRRTGDETLRPEPAARARRGSTPGSGSRRSRAIRSSSRTGSSRSSCGRRCRRLRMLWTLPRLLRRVGAALVHTQYAVPVRARRARRSSRSTTSPSRCDPAHMSLKDRLVFRRVVPRAARSARRVLTVSERTRADLRPALRPAGGRRWS